MNGKAMSSTSAMPRKTAQKVGYVVKRYPRFSETFIVNEILAHEATGLDIEIFALRPSVDTHFQNLISQVRASVNYLPNGSVKSGTFWRECHKLRNKMPKLWSALSEAQNATVVEAFQAIELAKQIRDKRISHLHAHFATSATTVAQLAARIAGITYSVTMHAKDIFHESVVPEDLKSKIAESEFVVTVSDFNHAYLSNEYGFGDKIHRIYNGLDLNLFNYEEKAEPSRKIISVGRLVHKKGFCHLIDACKILSDKGVDYECEILGTGELEEDLKNQIADLSLEETVKLVGPRPQNEVRDLIRAAQVFAAPCVIGDDGNRDGLPTVITESLALGTTCVATDVTGIPELVRNNDTGMIVAQGDPAALASELERLLDEPGLCQKLAFNARQLIEREFDIHKNVARIRELFPNSRGKTKSPHFVSSQLQGV